MSHDRMGSKKSRSTEYEKERTWQRLCHFFLLISSFYFSILPMTPQFYSWHFSTMMLLIGIWINFTKKPMNPIIANPIAVAMAIFWNSFLSGLVHLLTSRMESFTNCRLGSTNCITWSMTACIFLHFQYSEQWPGGSSNHWLWNVNLCKPQFPHLM